MALRNTTVYQPRGVCSRAIYLETEDGIVRSVRFEGGCNGNAQGVSRLVAGRPVAEVIERLRGIDCGGKGTSCPDQLAQALERVATQKPQETVPCR